MKIYHNNPPKDFWFYTIVTILLLGFLLWILFNFSRSNPEEIWKFLFLSPFIFILWVSFQISRYFWVYKKIDDGKTLYIDAETQTITIEQYGDSTSIHRSEVAIIKVFESWSAAAMSEFEYVEIVLKDDTSHIITGFTADRNAFSNVFKGIKRERKSKWMHMIPH